VRQHGPTHTIGTHLSSDYAAGHLHEQADCHSWLAGQAEKLAKVLRQTVGLLNKALIHVVKLILSWSEPPTHLTSIPTAIIRKACCRRADIRN
jgi:hypothetical protein